VTKDKYPASYLYTMITELLHEMDLSQYTVTDVCDFGYIPHSRGLAGRGMFVEVFTRDERGVISGTERHERLIEDDISYEDWGKPPTGYFYD
jgi:hypothetical protein